MNKELPIKIKLPEGFLDEEVRCDYTVSSDMKAVWAVELDLLVELLRVCKKYDIHIMSFAGTTLGAIRHGGYVPWDDDMDFALSRKDYNKLCEVASSEFKEPYFFQTEFTDIGSLRAHIQLRNSKTTGILNPKMADNVFGERYCKINQGIFIDIFPLDNIPDSESDFEKLKEVSSKYNKLAWKVSNCSNRMRTSISKTRGKRIIRKLANIFLTIFDKKGNIELYFYKKFEKEICKYDNIQTKRVGPISRFINDERFFISRDAVESQVWKKFEFIEIPVPIGYEEQLNTTYGDWKKFVKGASVHGNTIFDPYRSYLEYLK